MSEEKKPISPEDEITRTSDENTIELTETDLGQVTGGTDFKIGWK